MKKLIAILLLTFSIPAICQQVDVRGTRVWTSPSQTRLVIDVSGPVTHRIVPLANPDRLMIDISDAQLTGRLPRVETADPLLMRLRSGSPDGHSLRLVLDLKQRVRAKSFLMPPNERYGHRLIIDLLPKTSQGTILAGDGIGVFTSSRGAMRDLIIAIDAGHGGEDPGAIGPGGTYEKDVTLAIARRLATLVDQALGMRAVMIRDGDYYVGLRQRTLLAHKHHADLFLSIHADAFRDTRVSGASVYTLSSRGASSEAAQWLAEHENNADRIGGIELYESDNDLNRVLFELALNGAVEHSQYAAEQMIAKLGTIGPLHHDSVQQARFVVLNSPDVPSMLIETAFISNPHDEKRLRDPAHQQRIARSIFDGIQAYFAQHPLPGTQLASAGTRHHLIHRGDTLIEIAKRYDVTVRSLQNVNSLTTDRIRVGDVLTIPES
ncbi:N-acetylmuramoyl-L-alanine amidase [Thioflavicoccus mobilis 8321]|uniref:N-acetylmuramoyl-L-alanine amidase AmiC n=1 Tax=Thioflavicoccus mobilis 8321 TaxID=765912 RepID=L0GYU8_9GAMM|nr:N-acetylmuramoyl-L-alanine amidase [Thioflavicoccus mobilis]AGA90469.1 N-acetylmuramoyl-L-alanine amidase [Thioflavicoccus mobilis 8321]